MKQVKSIFTSSLAVVIIVLGLSVPTFAARHRSKRCTDHCADTYRVRKDACNLIPLKNERKICVRRAKEAKNDCKHRCH
jgi:hypothetical protein